MKLFTLILVRVREDRRGVQRQRARLRPALPARPLRHPHRARRLPHTLRARGIKVDGRARRGPASTG